MPKANKFSLQLCRYLTRHDVPHLPSSAGTCIHYQWASKPRILLRTTNLKSAKEIGR